METTQDTALIEIPTGGEPTHESSEIDDLAETCCQDTPASPEIPPVAEVVEAPVEDPVVSDAPDDSHTQAGLEKALRDTKAWATRLSQDNAALRKALDASLITDPPALLSDPGVAERLDRTRQALADFEEFGPLVDLLETVVHGISAYEREVAHHALLHTVMTDHPDALELRVDEEFLGWVNRQPAVVQACLQHSQDPAEVSWALGLYKRERDAGAAQSARENAAAALRERMRHAASPSPQNASGPGTQRFTRDEIARMSLDDYRKNEAHINAAIARGEIR